MDLQHLMSGISRGLVAWAAVSLNVCTCRAEPTEEGTVVPQAQYHWTFDDEVGRDEVPGHRVLLVNGATVVGTPSINPINGLKVLRSDPERGGSGGNLGPSSQFRVQAPCTLTGWIYAPNPPLKGLVGHIIGNYPGGPFQKGVVRLGLERDRDARFVIRFEAQNSKGESFQHFLPLSRDPLSWSGRWVHVVATLGPTHTALYCDGGAVTNRFPRSFDPGAFWFEAAHLPMMLGATNVRGAEPLHYVDNVRIYGKALSAAEVKHLYELELTGEAPVIGVGE